MLKRRHSQSGVENPAKKIKRIYEDIDSLVSTIDGIKHSVEQIRNDVINFDMSTFPSNGDNADECDICIDPAFCDHDAYDPEYDMNKFDQMNTDIALLIQIGNCYHCTRRTEHREIRLRVLKKLNEPLVILDQMIGMKEVKKAVVDHIIFGLEIFRKNNRCNECLTCIGNIDMRCENNDIANNNNDMMHTVITGLPGVGKTELGQILGRIYTAMGLLSRGTFHVAKRSDLIAKYLGQTAIKTQEFIDKCEGGVMFIDEAYSLGNAEDRDSFSKECIDTINQNLTEKRNFLCIIAGYKDDLENCFFAKNKGLARRFSFRYNISGYTHEELGQIFVSKLKNNKWTIVDEPFIKTFFKENAESFPHSGGDIETLFFACRIAHNRRHFLSVKHFGNVLTNDDILNGFATFIENRKSKKEIDQIMFPMYT